MMIHIHGNEARSTLSTIGDSKALQPNAVDLRLKKVFYLRCTEFVLSEDEKVHRESIEFQPKNGWWTLFPGAYEIIVGDTVSIAEGEAGFVVPRSTLSRNGVFITSGLYDAGYTGSMSACLHVTTDIFKIQYNTRVAQFLLFKAETLKLYEGSYGLKGIPEEEKYKR